MKSILLLVVLSLANITLPPENFANNKKPLLGMRTIKKSDFSFLPRDFRNIYQVEIDFCSEPGSPTFSWNCNNVGCGYNPNPSEGSITYDYNNCLYPPGNGSQDCGEQGACTLRSYQCVWDGYDEVYDAWCGEEFDYTVEYRCLQYCPDKKEK
jgi:hypothetical protein